METGEAFWLRLPRKCLPWQGFHVVALAKLQGAENSFAGSVEADCVQPVLHLHDLQTLSSRWKPLLASTYPWEILRQWGALTLKWHCCSRLCRCVVQCLMDKDWFTGTFTSPSCWCCHFCGHQVRDSINSAKSFPGPEAAWFDSGGITAGKQLLDRKSKSLANTIWISWFRGIEFTLSWSWARIGLEDVTVSVWPCRWLQNAVCQLPVTALLSTTRMDEGD